ncbi:MAG TPA: hypothetical protein VHX59_24935 [Mycobacteriales bacterium]|jgi:hypothetical protein|nr:hypothetical protein [Mycobacteriales bacterium]
MRFVPAQLSPLPVTADPGELPYGLVWDDLCPCLPDFDRPIDARRSYRKQGINKGTNSCILTLNYRAGREGRSRTLFFKNITDPTRTEAAKHRFLAAHGVPTPALRHTIERPGAETLIFEFLPIIGIEPAAADELVALIAGLNAVQAPPNALFQPNPGLPKAEFDVGVRTALQRLAGNAATARFVRPDRWFRSYKRVGEVVTTLPVALNHGELHYQQVGRSTRDSVLVLFDLETTALLQRFTDIADMLPSLSMFTGRSEHDLFAVYLRELRRSTGVALEESAALRELRLVRAVRLFWSLPWLFAMAGEVGMRDSPATAAQTLRDDLSELGLLA